MKKRFFLTLIVIFLLGFAGFLLKTTAGLRMVIRTARLFVPGQLSMQGVSGSLSDSISIASIDYQFQKKYGRITGLKLVWAFENFPNIKATLNWSSFLLSLSDKKNLQARSGHLALSSHFNGKKQGELHLKAKGQNLLHLSYQPETKWQLKGEWSSRENDPLKTRVAFEGKMENLDKIRLVITLDKGSYRMRDTPPFYFEGGEAVLLKKGSDLQLKGSFNVDPDKRMALAFNWPMRQKTWTAKGQIFLGKDVLTYDAKGAFKPELAAKMQLSGSHLQALETPEYQIQVSPDLGLEWQDNALTINGKVVIPEAKIQPRSFKNTKTLSKDVVFVDAPQTRFPFKVDVELEMGPAVALSLSGLTGILKGSVFLKQDLQKELTATGELQIREGKFEAYGQNLALTQGSILFTGGPLLSPQLVLRAQKKFTKTNAPAFTVGVDVAGDVHAPKVTLFSNPPLSEADKLSYLLLGKPVSEAHQAGGQLLLAALTSINVGEQGKDWLEKMKKSMAVDLGFENSSKYNAATRQTEESRSLVVGKSLSKRVYLSYNLGLSKEDVNALTLKYLLSKYFSLQVNASTQARGIDLFYTRE